jgi:hypothetical protein
MRIAAGILIIVGGFIGSAFWREFVGTLIILLGLVAVWGGICTLQKKRWGWALVGAICSIIFPFFGIPAIILLIKSKGEFD